MKKQIVILFLSITPFLSKSQINGFSKDDFIFSAKMNVVNYNTADKKYLNHQFNLNFGEFYSKNVAVGVGFAFGTSGKLADNFSAGIFGKYYTSPSSKFSFLTKSALQYNRSQDEEETVSSGSSLMFSPGVSYFLTNRLALEAYFGNIGYSTSKNEEGNKVRTNKFELGFDARNISFGILLRGN